MLTFEIHESADHDGARRLTVQGTLDLATAPEIETRLSTLNATGDPVRIDLSRVEFIDSTGLQVLLAWTARSRRSGWRLDVDPNVSDNAARLIELTGIGPSLWPAR